MSIKGLYHDENDVIIHGHGSEIYTKRYTAIDTDGEDLELASDFKEVLIHVEGSLDVVYMTGTHTDSTEIHLTSDGYTISEIPIVVDEDTAFVNVAAPSGTINVSLLAWR